MNYFRSTLLIILSFICSALYAGEFTISSYNCGGLSEHYDYLRAAVMQKIMQERHTAEPAQMALNEKIQICALKILFSETPREALAAQQEWDQNNYQEVFEELSKLPTDAGSPHAIWNQKVNEYMTSYNTRPVVIKDDEVIKMLEDHLQDLLKRHESDKEDLLEEARAIMAKRIFDHHLKFDLICLQEADYFSSSMLPPHYDVRLGLTDYSKKGIAWNTERFKLIKNIGNIAGRAFALLLRDLESGKKVLVCSAHLKGCNPYKIEYAKNDSQGGDEQLKTVIDLFETYEADIKLIGMDSNVTSLHPRLKILKEGGYQIDCDHFEETCSNPYQVLNTRIDWIALKKGSNASIMNIPVLNVGLNTIQNNFSDHKPIAAKILEITD